MHLDIVRQNDESAQAASEHMLEVTKLKDEIANLIALSGVKDDQLLRKDRDIDRLKKVPLLKFLFCVSLHWLRLGS